MAKLRREKSIDVVVQTPSDTFWNIQLSRVVPANDCAAYMKAEVRLADDETGNYDGGMDPVITVNGIDTLDLQCVLKDMIHEIAQLTGVHVMPAPAMPVPVPTNEEMDEMMDLSIPSDTIPVGDGVSTPYWTHDCNQCTWLGSRIFEDCTRFDFYWCGKASDDEGCGIIRNSNMPEDNESYLLGSMRQWSGHEPHDKADVLKQLVITHLYM